MEIRFSRYEFECMINAASRLNLRGRMHRPLVAVDSNLNFAHSFVDRLVHALQENKLPLERELVTMRETMNSRIASLREQLETLQTSNDVLVRSVEDLQQQIAQKEAENAALLQELAAKHDELKQFKEQTKVSSSAPTKIDSELVPFEGRGLFESESADSSDLFVCLDHSCSTGTRNDYAAKHDELMQFKEQTKVSSSAPTKIDSELVPFEGRGLSESESADSSHEFVRLDHSCSTGTSNDYQSFDDCFLNDGMIQECLAFVNRPELTDSDVREYNNGLLDLLMDSFLLESNFYFAHRCQLLLDDRLRRNRDPVLNSLGQTAEGPLPDGANLEHVTDAMVMDAARCMSLTKLKEEFTVSAPYCGGSGKEFWFPRDMEDKRVLVLM
jgi:hypothetical protein